jgi:serine/threonine-protein kinase
MAAVPAGLATALQDRYRLDRELGHGGMATVYLARDLKHDRDVALKVLRPELAATLGSDRFLREITLTAQLNHPHILPLLDSGQAPAASGAYLYYVMPYVEGESLRDRLNREKQLPLDDALQITREVADALCYAHSHHVIHRDIKPENILLESGHAVVADFGIARAISAAGGEKLTETGLAVGTPAYMSPEQAAGERDLDGRSDEYALGCVLYEMLAGQPPFTGPTAESIVRQHIAAPAPNITVIRPGVRAGVAAALQRAMAKAPADRFRTTAELVAALGEGTAADQGPGGAAESRRRRRVTALRVGGLVLVIVVAAVALLKGRSGRSVQALASAPRVALLPCVNMTRDTTQDWLADRWTDELTGKLSQLGTLIVRPYGSVQRFKGTAASPRDVATALDVDHLVNCQITLRGDSVRLVLSVTAAEQEAVTWSHTYERLLGGAVYNDFQVIAARQIATALGADPSEAGLQQRSERGTKDSVALRLYRQAMAAQDWRAKMWLLEQAIGRDPSFVLPYVQLAGWYTVAAADSMPPQRAYHAIDTLLARALAIDSLHPEVLAERAGYLLDWERDWPGARDLFQRAIAASPNSAGIRWRYGNALGTIGASNEALAQTQKAIELDPSLSAYLGLEYLRAARAREAESLMRRRLAADPEDMGAKFVLGYTLVALQQYAEGISLLELAYQAWDQNLTLAMLGYAYGRAGRTAQAQGMLTELRRREGRGYVDPGWMALIEIGNGSRSSALELLEQSFEDGGGTILFLLGPNPWFDPLRNEPRFRALRQKAGVYVGGP